MQVVAVLSENDLMTNEMLPNFTLFLVYWGDFSLSLLDAATERVDLPTPVDRIVVENTAVKESAETCWCSRAILQDGQIWQRQTAHIFSPYVINDKSHVWWLGVNMESVSTCGSVMMKMCLVSYTSWKLNVPSQVCERWVMNAWLGRKDTDYYVISKLLRQISIFSLSSK